MGTQPAWWVPRENSFFRETLGESVQNRCFGGVRQRLVTRARGKASGCDPVGVVEGPCGYPAG